MGELQRAQQAERDAILAALWELRLSIRPAPDGTWSIPNQRQFDAAATDADRLLHKIRGEPAEWPFQGTRELPLLTQTRR